MKPEVILEAGQDARSGARLRTRIVLVMALAAVVAVGWGVWRLFLRAPSPSAVCEHLEAVHAFPRMPISIGDQTPPSGTARQQCEWYYSATRKVRGFWGYGRVARCAIEAANGPDAELCEHGD